MSDWQLISTVPSGVVIVTDGDAWTAIAFREDDVWWIGRPEHDCREELEFEPLFWLPRNFPTNPFRASFPDRQSIAEMHPS